MTFKQKIYREEVEAKIGQLEALAVKIVPPLAKPKFAFKLPMKVRDKLYENEFSYVGGRVLVRGDDKRTFFDLSDQGKEAFYSDIPVYQEVVQTKDHKLVFQVDDNGHIICPSKVRDIDTKEVVFELSCYPNFCHTNDSVLAYSRGCPTVDLNTGQNVSLPIWDKNILTEKDVELLKDYHWTGHVFDVKTGNLIYGYPGYIRDFRESSYFVDGMVLKIMPDYQYSGPGLPSYHIGDDILNLLDPKRKSIHKDRRVDKVYTINGMAYYINDNKEKIRDLRTGKVVFDFAQSLNLFCRDLISICGETWARGSDKISAYSIDSGRRFNLDVPNGIENICDIPGKNPLIQSGDNQTFYEIPMEKVVTINQIKNVFR